MSRDLEKTLVEAVNRAKATQELKLFKQFNACKNYEERLEIHAKVDVLEGVVFDIINDIRNTVK